MGRHLAVAVRAKRAGMPPPALPCPPVDPTTQERASLQRCVFPKVGVAGPHGWRPGPIGATACPPPSVPIKGRVMAWCRLSREPPRCRCGTSYGAAHTRQIAGDATRGCDECEKASGKGCVIKRNLRLKLAPGRPTALAPQSVHAGVPLELETDQTVVEDIFATRLT